jgi:hypothetical protein
VVGRVAICVTPFRVIAATFAAVLIGSLIWLMGVAQSAQLAHCPPAATTVLKRFSDVVVYRRPPAARDRAATINVCVRATRRSSRLTYDGYYFDFAGRHALAARGRVVAWAQVIRDDGADGDVAVLNILARDLDAPRDALELYARSNGTRYGCERGYCISASAVSQIVIAADGTVVWIACDAEGVGPGDDPIYDKCGPGARSIWAARRGYDLSQRTQPGALRELARGSSIAGRSLRLRDNGRRISWTQRQQHQSAVL